MKYRAEIDGLRALAVLPVILFHAGFEWFSGGFVGVDVFFVISGYLITTIIISEMAEGKFSIINFYERRARRILPALFFVMLMCIPFAWMWMLPDALENFGQSLVSTSLFSNNFLLMNTAGYWDLASEYVNNNLLSSPDTHILNIVSGLTQVLWKPAVMLLRGANMLTRDRHRATIIMREALQTLIYQMGYLY